MRSGKAIWNMRGHAKQIIGLDMSPDGYQVATGSDDHTVRIWDMRKRKTSNIILAHNSLISYVKYQPNYGNYLVTAGYDNLVKIWSVLDYSLVSSLSGHSDKISSIDISPNTFPYSKTKRESAVKKETEMDVDLKTEDQREDMSMDVQGDDDPFVGYCAPVRFVSTSFDRTWKVWEEDKLCEI
jgi:WD40 repeat protein